MGQINTNNYPTVSSLADADLLIVENATHGTGTTTPKQLRENAIGTDPLQTTAQTVTGAINEIFEMATDTVVGLELGKMTSFSDGTIVTDIDLHRAPVAGDRILFYHSTSVASPSSLTTYNDGVAVTTAISDFSMTHPAGLTLMKCVALGESLRWQTVQDIASGYTAGIGISINGTTINNTAPQLGDDIAYSRIDTVTSGALGYFSADADCLVMDFRTDAEPYNGGYTLRLTTTGASFKYAVLKDKAGNNYAEEIPSGSLVLCKSNVSGTGSEADPVVVTVLEIGNVEMAHDVEVLKDICITEKTASGNPLTVTDALPYPAVSLSAEIEASQDLHGYDKPWVGGAGKNKLPITAESTGIFTVNKDTDNNAIGITVNGTPSANVRIGNSMHLDAGSYILTGCPSGGSTSTYNLSIRINNTSGTIVGDMDIGTGGNVTIETSGEYYFAIVIGSGYTANNLVFKPMLRLSTESDATFAPYSNICPISGRTSVTITDYDSESNTATVTIQLGQTVYDGNADITEGSGTSAGYKFNLEDGDWTPHSVNNNWFYAANVTDFKQYGTGTTKYANAKSNGLKFYDSTDWQAHDGSFSLYNQEGVGNRLFIRMDACAGMTGAQFKQWLEDNGLYMVYEKATGDALSFTSEQLQMLKGYNRLSSDGGGDITLTYKADRLAAIEAALAELQNT